MSTPDAADGAAQVKLAATRLLHACIGASAIVFVPDAPAARIGGALRAGYDPALSEETPPDMVELLTRLN
jgi:hypothetical protein